jgi:hypothetical protein
VWDVPAVATLKIAVFWDVTPCSMIGIYERFGGICCVCVQGAMYRQQFLPEHIYLPNYMASHLRRQRSIYMVHIICSTGIVLRPCRGNSTTALIIYNNFVYNRQRPRFTYFPFEQGSATVSLCSRIWVMLGLNLSEAQIILISRSFSLCKQIAG